MKKHIRNLVFFGLAVVLVSGCALDDSEKMKTAAGKDMFTAWDASFNRLVSDILEPAFNFNAWLAAPESEKEEILNRLFLGNGNSYYEEQITFTELSPNHWVFRFRNEVILQFQIIDGNSLNDPDAMLIVQLAGHKSFWDCFINMPVFIKNAGPGKWTVASNGSDECMLSGTLSLKDWNHDYAPASLFSESDIEFEGNGFVTYHSGDNYYLTFKTEHPVSWNWDLGNGSNYYSHEWWNYGFTSNWMIKSGKVRLTAYDKDGTQGNTTMVTALGNQNISVEIGGVTQEWSLKLYP